MMRCKGTPKRSARISALHEEVAKVLRGEVAKVLRGEVANGVEVAKVAEASGTAIAGNYVMVFVQVVWRAADFVALRVVASAAVVVAKIALVGEADVARSASGGQEFARRRGKVHV